MKHIITSRRLVKSCHLFVPFCVSAAGRASRGSQANNKNMIAFIVLYQLQLEGETLRARVTRLEEEAAFSKASSAKILGDARSQMECLRAENSKVILRHLPSCERPVRSLLLYCMRFVPTIPASQKAARATSYWYRLRQRCGPSCWPTSFLVSKNKLASLACLFRTVHGIEDYLQQWV